MKLRTAPAPHPLPPADAVNERRPIALAEAEADQIAAGGSKLGGSTEGRGLLATPTTFSA